MYTLYVSGPELVEEVWMALPVEEVTSPCEHWDCALLWSLSKALLKGLMKRLVTLSSMMKLSAGKGDVWFSKHGYSLISCSESQYSLVCADIPALMVSVDITLDPSNVMYLVVRVFLIIWT